MIVAIDGPAGAGKSTIARMVAKQLGFLYIDTGAMYRALTLKVIEDGIDAADIEAVASCAAGTSIDLIADVDGSLKVALDGRDVTRLIRQPRVSALVSDIARIKSVREILVKLQRGLGAHRNSVLDGRDIGTVVFPDAESKFYLDASFTERVDRRYKEMVAAGSPVTPEAVSADLRNRDTIDSTRAHSPLRQAHDAIYIDTTRLSIEDVVAKVMSCIPGHTPHTHE